MIPSRSIRFLGYSIDSIQERIFLPEEKIKVQNAVKTQTNLPISIRAAMSVLGLLTASIPAVQWACLYAGDLQQAILRDWSYGESLEKLFRVPPRSEEALVVESLKLRQGSTLVFPNRQEVDNRRKFLGVGCPPGGTDGSGDLDSQGGQEILQLEGTKGYPVGTLGLQDTGSGSPYPGSYRLGPCSVNAVKEGDVDKPYDAPFTFCEVNGDQVDWLVYSNERRRISTITSAIGKFISTKAIGSNRRADITNNYKYTEGSKKERETFNKAESICSSMLSRNTNDAIISLLALSVNDTEPVPKPDFEGAFTHNDPQIGQDVTFTLVLKSISSVKISLQLKMTATAIIYTNAQVKEILREAQSVTLEPKEEKKIPFSISYAQYEAAITTDNMIKAVVLCEDEKGGKLLVDSVVKLSSQPIMIKTTGEAHVSQPLQIEIIFTNPISQDIDNTILTVEGSGLVKRPIHIEIPCLKKNQQLVTNVNIIPYRGGSRCVVVDLSSKKFSDIKGTLPINVSSE
ncbi:protein-glutamine gamma-glutamyltransferase E-like [Lithobates pipiens]